jgi:hypothetical protein
MKNHAQPKYALCNACLAVAQYMTTELAPIDAPCCVCGAPNPKVAITHRLTRLAPLQAVGAAFNMYYRRLGVLVTTERATATH